MTKREMINLLVLAIKEIKTQYALRFFDEGDFLEVGEKNETLIKLREALRELLAELEQEAE